MAIAQGHKSYLQVGTESTWGTPVAATQKLEIISEDVKLVVSEIEDPSLYNARSRRDIIDGGQYAMGPLRRRANYEGELQLLRAGMGAYSNATVEAGVIDHTFKEGDQKSLTLQLPKGDIPAGKVFRAVGMKSRGFVFECQANGQASFEYDFLGKDMQADQTPTGSLSFPTSRPVLFSQIPSGALVDGTADAEADVRVRSIKISYSTPLTEDRFFLGPSPNMDEPIPSDFVTCEWEIQQEFKTKAAFDSFYRTRTVSTLDFKFRHPDTIGAASKRELQFTSWAAKLMDYSPPVSGYGVLISTARWKAFYDASTASSLVVRVRSTESALP